MSTAREISVADRLFALQRCPPLDRVRDAEMPHIAQAARAREYAPGEVIAPADWTLRNLIITIEGETRTSAGPAPRVFGEVSLLFGTVLDEPLFAGAEGATCLLIGRAHFFTIINECPTVLLGFLERDSASTPYAEAGT